MEHIDLLEDIVLAVLVSSTTFVTLYVGWRAGRAARRRPGGDRGGPVEAGSPREGDGLRGRREPIAAWIGRLEAEQARVVRHGEPATIVAFRLGKASGPLARRAEAEIQRTVGTADAVARGSRASDVVRVTEDGIVRVLLVETSESGAHAYVNRISGDLRAGADAATGEVVAAWASVAPSRDLAAADRLAVARLRGATGGWLRSLAVHRAVETSDAETTAEPAEAVVDPGPGGLPG